MRKYLLQKDSTDLRDYIFCTTCFKEVKALPVKIDLREKCSPIVDQGQLGSCTANAIASGLREYMLKATNAWVALSRLFLYWEERYFEGTVKEDSGAQIRDGMKVLQKIGVCPEANWPYNIHTFTQSPTEQELVAAAPYKIAEYHRITSLIQIKASVAEALPVVIGMEVYSSFEGKDVAATGLVPLPKADVEELLGGHAVLVVGYDDSNEQFVVRNSWGVKWGDQGYFYLPYDYYRKGYINDCWTSRG
ncbi:MAG: C1 family peptidase [Sporomusaceae bacterium]|nr:C1 family peptidase [Sporomusaceae bacterium]